MIKHTPALLRVVNLNNKKPISKLLSIVTEIKPEWGELCNQRRFKLRGVIPLGAPLSADYLPPLIRNPFSMWKKSFPEIKRKILSTTERIVLLRWILISEVIGKAKLAKKRFKPFGPSYFFGFPLPSLGPLSTNDRLEKLDKPFIGFFSDKRKLVNEIRNRPKLWEN